MPNTQTHRRNFNAKRILFDTNILIDIVDSTRPGSQEARLSLRNCNGSGDGDMGMTTPMSLKDAYYILTKRFGEDNARRCIDFFLEQLVVSPLGAEECIMSARSDEPDFEDGLIRAAAELNHVDFILTRDAEAFDHSSVKSISCKKYLEIVAARNDAER